MRLNTPPVILGKDLPALFSHRAYEPNKNLRHACCCLKTLSDSLQSRSARFITILNKVRQIRIFLIRDNYVLEIALFKKQESCKKRIPVRWKELCLFARLGSFLFLSSLLCYNILFYEKERAISSINTLWLRFTTQNQTSANDKNCIVPEPNHFLISCLILKLSFIPFIRTQSFLFEPKQYPIISQDPRTSRSNTGYFRCLNLVSVFFFRCLRRTLGSAPLTEFLVMHFRQILVALFWDHKTVYTLQNEKWKECWW